MSWSVRCLRSPVQELARNVRFRRVNIDFSSFLTHSHKIEVLCFACIFKYVHDLFGGVVICAAKATTARKLMETWEIMVIITYCEQRAAKQVCVGRQTCAVASNRITDLLGMQTFSSTSDSDSEDSAGSSSTDAVRACPSHLTFFLFKYCELRAEGLGDADTSSESPASSCKPDGGQARFFGGMYAIKCLKVGGTPYNAKMNFKTG